MSDLDDIYRMNELTQYYASTKTIYSIGDIDIVVVVGVGLTVSN